MATMVSARIPDATAEELRARALDEERTVSDLVNRALQEYLRAARFPGIVFVPGADGRRRARLPGGPDLWEVVFVAGGWQNDVDKTARYLGVSAVGVRLALSYYAAYPEEIDARLRRMLDFDADPQRGFPGVRVVSVPDECDAPPA